MKLDHKTALIILDAQKAVMRTQDPCHNPDFVVAIKALLTIWRQSGYPVFFTQHHSDDIHSPYFHLSPYYEWIDEVAPLPIEPVIQKKSANAFLQTALGSMIRIEGCDKVVICGAYTHESVDVSAKHALGLKFDVSVVDDACCAKDVSDRLNQLWDGAHIHALFLSLMEQQDIQVINLSTVLQRLMQA